jgi:hypothetical protein
MNGTLVYLICSLANPNLCEEHARFSPGVLSCIHGAQGVLAAEQRPGWRVARWRCEPGARRGPKTTTNSRDSLGAVARNVSSRDDPPRP